MAANSDAFLIEALNERINTRRPNIHKRIRSTEGYVLAFGQRLWHRDRTIGVLASKSWCPTIAISKLIVAGTGCGAGTVNEPVRFPKGLVDPVSTP